MAMEVLVAKLIGPHFGASLYVWAATIGTTLIGLATGYYLSGLISEKENLSKNLFKITAATAVYIIILPFFSEMIMNALISLEVRTGIIISTLLFNFPLFALFGLFSPIIIELINRKNKDLAGNHAGFIYGVSTISGVVFMLIIGIFILPTIGMYPPVYGCGFLLLLVALVQFLNLKKNEE